MNLVKRVHQTALEEPQKIAYHFMGKDTTYAEFDQTVGLLAAGLQKSGIGKGGHVAFLLGNTPHFLLSLYATMRIGATAVPVNPIYSPEEIAFIVRNSDAKAVIALDKLLPLIRQASAAFPTVESYVICETEPGTEEEIASLQDDIRGKVKPFTHVVASGGAPAEAVEVD
ncbi:MAG: AMP-binding protein, partial [Bhargavaea sp.]